MLRAAASLASFAALMADSGAPSVGWLASSSRLPLTHFVGQQSQVCWC